MDKTDLGNRMKSYEQVSQTKLTRRTPVTPPDRDWETDNY